MWQPTSMTTSEAENGPHGPYSRPLITVFQMPSSIVNGRNRGAVIHASAELHGWAR